MNAYLTLVALTTLWPLVLGGLCLHRDWRGSLLPWLASAPLPALLLALLPLQPQPLNYAWLLLGASQGLDDSSRLFLFFCALLWLVACIGLPGGERPRLAPWLLTVMAANFWVLLAQDIPSFYLAYAVMGLGVFGLVLRPGDPASHRAAQIYLVLAVLGELLLFAALAEIAVLHDSYRLPVASAGALPSDVMALLLLGFGIKAGVLLLHVSLPLIYTAVPLALSVPLAGALLHLGLFGWMRFLPLGEVAQPTWAQVFILTGLAGMVAGVVLGLMQTLGRSLLAYSSVSQMGLMLVILGIGLASPSRWPQLEALLLLFALHHALAKGALFCGLGTAGRWRYGLWLPALALAGFPALGGALVKSALKVELPGLPGALPDLLAWVLPLSALGTALLMARFLWLALPAADQDATATWSPPVWVILLAAVCLLPWGWPLPLQRTFELGSALWPLAAAVLLVGLLLLVRRLLQASGSAWRWPTLPPGDLALLLAPRVERWLRPLFATAGHQPPGRAHSGGAGPGGAGAGIAAEGRRLRRLKHHIRGLAGTLLRLEARLPRWPVVISLMLLIMISGLGLLVAVV